MALHTMPTDRVQSDHICSVWNLLSGSPQDGAPAGVFILRHKPPKMTALYLIRTKWSNQRKETLGEASRPVIQGLRGTI